MSSSSISQVSGNENHNTESKNLFGFWVYIMTDCVLFAILFATYIVLRNNTYGGPSGDDLFNLPYILAETLILLTSSLTCGIALLASRKGLKSQTLLWLGVTFLLGLSFLILEINEFSEFYNEGYSWRTSGFLSAFFTLVGTHGLHITAGLIWMGLMFQKIYKNGLKSSNIRKLTMLGVFWHFLDIIWIFIFSIVFMMGVL